MSDVSLKNRLALALKQNFSDKQTLKKIPKKLFERKFNFADLATDECGKLIAAKKIFEIMAVPILTQYAT